MLYPIELRVRRTVGRGGPAEWGIMPGSPEKSTVGGGDLTSSRGDLHSFEPYAFVEAFPAVLAEQPAALESAAVRLTRAVE